MSNPFQDVLDESFTVKDHTGKTVHVAYTSGEAKRKAEELTKQTGKTHTAGFKRTATVKEEVELEEAAKWRDKDLEGKSWEWDGDSKKSVAGVDYSGDELKSRPGNWRSKADMAKRMTKKGTPTAAEKGFQDNLKNRIKMKQKSGGLTGPKGNLPEGVELEEEHLDELSGATLGSYIQKAHKDKTKKFDHEKELDANPKVKATLDKRRDLVLARSYTKDGRSKHADQIEKLAAKAVDQKKKIDPQYPMSGERGGYKRYRGIEKAVARLSGNKKLSEEILDEVELEEADKHSFIGKIKRKLELQKKVDSSFKDIGIAQRAGDHPAASKAFRKHERYANLEAPGTWTKVKEEVEVEEIEEISKGLAQRYSEKAGKEMDRGFNTGFPTKKTFKRMSGVYKAQQRVHGAKPTSEDVELDEKAGDLRDYDVHSKMASASKGHDMSKLGPTAAEKERAAKRAAKKKSILGRLFGEETELDEGADIPKAHQVWQKMNSHEKGAVMDKVGYKGSAPKTHKACIDHINKNMDQYKKHLEENHLPAGSKIKDGKEELTIEKPVGKSKYIVRAEEPKVDESMVAREVGGRKFVSAEAAIRLAKELAAKRKPGSKATNDDLKAAHKKLTD